MKQYIKFNDPGHGWLKVPMAEVRQAIAAGYHFTFCSYQSPSGRYAYLEEDCDMSEFMRFKHDGNPEWFKSLDPNRPGWRTRYTPRDRQSTIRSYPRLSCGEWYVRES